jgi:hypothetical protein
LGICDCDKAMVETHKIRTRATNEVAFMGFRTS